MKKPTVSSPSSSRSREAGKQRSSIDSRHARKIADQFDLREAPGHLLRRCHSRARAIFDDLIGRQTGLSKQQMALMVAIARIPNATHAQLSEETGFDRNTLADTLDRLISKGLARRERSEIDARAYQIQLTSDGINQLESLIPLAHEVQQKIIEPLPEELRPIFIQCLRILAGIDEADLRDAPGLIADDVR
ncbi:MarR family winged helix-turn-helix transcriptional regulator [Paraburkholderia fungorum]|uniref:MarR family winged helix-turn-helix transcriptional regulator n=1 Tax=Paraburkholderia fungorum TaxID=134537 RepID=UPI0038BD1070